MTAGGGGTVVVGVDGSDAAWSAFDWAGEEAELTDREREICARIGPALRERGFIFVGIDVIGDYMTEINVTSPTGIREVKRFSGTDVAALLWNAIERKRG